MIRVCVYIHCIYYYLQFTYFIYLYIHICGKQTKQLMFWNKTWVQFRCESAAPRGFFLQYYRRWTMEYNPCCVVVAPASPNFNVVFGLRTWVRWTKNIKPWTQRKLYIYCIYSSVQHWNLGCGFLLGTCLQGLICLSIYYNIL